MSHDWGYRTAKKHAKDIGLGPSAKAARVEVKTHSRAPRTSKAPPAPVSPAKGMPKQAGMSTGKPTAPVMTAFAKGGAVKKYEDSAKDKKQDAKAAAMGMAKGGAAKMKKGC